MENKLIAISPQQYADTFFTTKQTVCNWLRAGKVLDNAVKVERMGNRWIIYVSSKLSNELISELLKES